MIRVLKYIILGGSGFIGKNLSEFLLEQGYDVTVFDIEKINLKHQNIHYIKGDFFNDQELKAAIMDKDVIIHAISTINPGNSNEKYLLGYEKDFIQTIKMCSWIKDTDKKFIFLSSGGTIYGEHDVSPLTEDILPRPINHYANIKLSIENALRVFHIQNRLNIIIARISNPYGPGQDFTKGVGFIDAVLKQSMVGETVEIWGDGNNIRDYIYIDDVCKWLYKLSLYTGKEYIFNISSGKGITQNKIIEIIKELGVLVKINYKRARSVDIKKVILDNTKIKEVYYMEPISVEEGIRNYYEYIGERIKKKE